MRSLDKFYPSLGISHNLLKGLGVSDFVSVSHIFAFPSSHYTFSSRARILKCQSQRLGESQIYHSPPLYCINIYTVTGKLVGILLSHYMYNVNSQVSMHDMRHEAFTVSTVLLS